MSPLVSIIVPVHNAEATICQCVDSVIAQSYQAIELILCNDHSSDQTEHQIEKYLSDSRVRRLDTDRRGACAARNLGFEQSRGEYIQFFDADDLLAPEKIERQVRQLGAVRKPDETVSFSSLVQFRCGSSPASGEVWHDTAYSNDRPLSFLVELLAGDRFVQTGQWLTPRRLVEKAGPWDETLAADQDGEFFSRVLKHADAVIGCPDAATYYRRAAAGQISGGLEEKHFASRLSAFEKKLELLRDFVPADELQKVVQKQCSELALGSYPRSRTTSRRALSLLKKHACSFRPEFPTNRLNMIARLMGWRTARWCSYVKNSGRG